MFWAGFALFAAGLCGELCHRAWRLPRITGYAVIGLIAGSFGLLLFELGNRLDLRWIRRNPWLIASSLAEATLTFVLVLAALLLKVSWMVAIVLSAISNSPAMVLQLKTELRAEGQVSQRLMTLSALNSVYAVVLTKLVTSCGCIRRRTAMCSRPSSSRSTCSRDR